MSCIILLIFLTHRICPIGELHKLHLQQYKEVGRWRRRRRNSNSEERGQGHLRRGDRVWFWVWVEFEFEAHVDFKELIFIWCQLYLSRMNSIWHSTGQGKLDSSLPTQFKLSRIQLGFPKLNSSWNCIRVWFQFDLSLVWLWIELDLILIWLWFEIGSRLNFMPQAWFKAK